jgi:iron complex outermembrane receptor protein
MPIRTNAAFFYARYEDIQTQTQSSTSLGNLVPVIGNANEATIKGMELEIALSPSEGLELFGNYGYTRGEFDTFSSSVIGTTDLSGVHFSQPRYTTAFRLRYMLPIGTDNGEVVFSASYYRRSKTGETLAQDQKSRIDAYDIMNLRLDWLDVMGWPVDAAVVLTNAADEEYVEGQFAVNPSVGFIARSFGPPRQWGLELRYRF